MQSPSTERYLGAIYRLGTEDTPVPVSVLAQRMGVSRVSANEMVKKLQSLALVVYEPYKGVTLTSRGAAQALDIVRRHRIWERFLVDVLEMPWDAAHEEACELAHATSPQLLETLSQFLGEPDTCPHGNPVPSAAGAVADVEGCSLRELAVGQQGVVLRVPEEEPGVLAYLDKLGLRPRAEVTVEEAAPFDGPLTVRVAGTRQVVGRKLAERILVRSL